MENTVVRTTAPRASDGLFGDGIAVIEPLAPGNTTITASLIADSVRAGVSSFGAYVSLTSTAIRCTALSLDGESYEGGDFAFDDRGGNACGCPEPNGSCQVLSADLEPPEPLQ